MFYLHQQSPAQLSCRNQTVLSVLPAPATRSALQCPACLLHRPSKPLPQPQAGVCRGVFTAASLCCRTPIHTARSRKIQAGLLRGLRKQPKASGLRKNQSSLALSDPQSIHCVKMIYDGPNHHGEGVNSPAQKEPFPTLQCDTWHVDISCSQTQSPPFSLPYTGTSLAVEPQR